MNNIIDKIFVISIFGLAIYLMYLVGWAIPNNLWPDPEDENEDEDSVDEQGK